MHRKNKKYKSLLVTAKELFWKFGFRRVTIEEICREANVSKMTFYKFFKNKDELAITILDTIYEESMGKFEEIWNNDMDMEQRFQQMLLLKTEATKNISMEFIQDIYLDTESNPAKFMNAKTSEVSARMITMYKEGQKKGWIREDLNAEFLFFFMQNAITFIQGPEAKQFFNHPQDLILELTRLFLYGIHPLPAKK